MNVDNYTRHCNCYSQLGIEHFHSIPRYIKDKEQGDHVGVPKYSAVKSTPT